MADILLNKIINSDIDVELLVKWLIKVLPENEDNFKEILGCNVAQIDFITYFINFIHQEAPCKGRIGETPQKRNTPKRIDKMQVHSYREQSKVINSNLFISEKSTTPNLNNSSNSIVINSVGKYSTPKGNRTSLNKSSTHFSPVSPLYQNHNSFGSKEDKNDNIYKKSADKHSLCLGDFIVTNLKNSSKKKRISTELPDDTKETSRRIKPTSIYPKQGNTDFQKTENSFNFQENIPEVSAKSATEQRNVLLDERMKMLSCKDSLDKNSHVFLSKRHNSLSQRDISPCLAEVTFKTKIDCMVTIYTTILKYKMVLNITSEIYFLISLLLSKQPECFRESSKFVRQDNSFEESNLGVEYLDQCGSTSESSKDGEMPEGSRLYNSEIFENIHNVVYFAVQCLEAQIEIIRLYDKTTIKLLADNERIQSYSQYFSKKLLSYAEKKTEKSSIEYITPTSQLNVCFNIDTDNKENYPDQSSFHAFRKQRDLFYEILRIWETYHLSSDWTFSVRLGGKIRTLFSLNCEATNFIHLARLFKYQLLSNCARGPKEQGLSENNLSFLPSVTIDAEKLNRLTNRLVTKQASNGINSLPVFTGHQEFYRDFIIVASNHFFNKHLGDSLISEIIELNDTKFNEIEIDEDNEVDPNTRKRYVNCIKNLRILAKFLGFIDSLPYRSEVPNLSKNILESQIKTREQCSPALDVKLLLTKSIENNSVVLLTPWLTKYLAMLDYVTLRLSYYNSVHKILFDLYRNIENSEKNSYNTAVVKFCLGWLFELPHFPDSEYFNFCLTISDTSNNIRKKDLSKKSNGINGIKVKLKSKGIDQLRIINQSVLYLCCPYLEEIKKLLSTNASSGNIAVKYITPVTAVESNSEMARKKLEQQLEDAFFSGQPSSLRKTIEFVSERIASAAVKYICYDLVPKAREMAVTDLKENLLKNHFIDGDDTERKTVLKKQTMYLAQKHFKQFLQMCDDEVQKISNQKIPQALDSLLPIDALKETKNVCVNITTKMYIERVQQWVQSHVNLTMFSKDFDSEFQKAFNGRKLDKDKPPFLLPSGGRECDHNEDSLSGFYILNNIREACCKLIDKSDVTEEFIVTLLEDCYKSLTERNDVNDMITVNIFHTLFDLCLLLVSNLPSVFSTNDNIINLVAKIWILQPKTKNLFKTLFCPRNIKILQQSENSSEAWDMYAKVISHLVDKEMIEQEEFESQCTGFYNRDWEQGTLENFSHFLKKFVVYSKCDTTDSSFAYLLDFLSDFCSDL